ncbi:26S proteasome complex subunit [Saguinus oedipus]|uniref:26S proteasome complex subunit SEM1 n=1 Tax=Saguinus oedipus TaxID=9490 RepID=A0ABQ9UI94_SAGOE|nr:26S proteasome complex subunit [Saguinus oedipus]
MVWLHYHTHEYNDAVWTSANGNDLLNNWAGLDEDEDAHVWEDNWDDDNVEDDFSNQLRTWKPLTAELEKHGYKMETS